MDKTSLEGDRNGLYLGSQTPWHKSSIGTIRVEGLQVLPE